MNPPPNRAFNRMDWLGKLVAYDPVRAPLPRVNIHLEKGATTVG